MVGKPKCIRRSLLTALFYPQNPYQTIRLNIEAYDTLLSKVIVKTLLPQSTSFPSSSFCFPTLPSFMPTTSYQTMQTQTNSFCYSTNRSNSDNTPSQSSYFPSSSLFLPSLPCCRTTPIEPSSFKTKASTIVLSEANIWS